MNWASHSPDAARAGSCTMTGGAGGLEGQDRVGPASKSPLSTALPVQAPPALLPSMTHSSGSMPGSPRMVRSLVMPTGAVRGQTAPAPGPLSWRVSPAAASVMACARSSPSFTVTVAAGAPAAIITAAAKAAHQTHDLRIIRPSS